MDALSFLQDVSGYTQAQSGPVRRVKLATVDDTYDPDDFLTGTLPKVTFDGEATLSGKTYPVLAPYHPHPDDRVVMLPMVVGGTMKYVIAGTLDAAANGYLGGDLVVVGNVDVTGDLAVDDITAGLLRLTDTTDVTTSSTGHAFQIGASNSTNLRADANEIQALSNGAVSSLGLNADGGEVQVNGNAASNAVSLRLTNGELVVSDTGTDADDLVASSTESGLAVQQDGFTVVARSLSSFSIAPMYINRTGSSNTGRMLYFRIDGSNVGYVNWNGSTMALADESDRRLKQNIADLTGALERVKLLRPRTFRWRSSRTRRDDGTIREGFIADEFAQVLPQHVEGNPDDVYTAEDEVRLEEVGQPRPQAINMTGAVPLLTAAVKELAALVEAQQTRIAALETRLGSRTDREA